MKNAVSAIAAAQIVNGLEKGLPLKGTIVEITARWNGEAEKPLFANDDGSTVFVGPTFRRGDHGFREGDIRNKNPLRRHREAKHNARRRGDSDVVKYCNQRAEGIVVQQIGCYKLDKHGINRNRRLARGALKIAHLEAEACIPPRPIPMELPKFDHDLYLAGVDPNEIHIHLNS